MQKMLLGAGIAALFGAIVGGGLKAFNIELPLVRTVGRQLLLGGLGVILAVVGISGSFDSTAKPVTRAAWVRQVNPECTKMLNAAGAMSAKYSAAQAAVEAGQVDPVRDLADDGIPAFIKVANDFVSHVREIDPPAGDDKKIDTMLSSLTEVVKAYGRIATHERNVADTTRAMYDAARHTTDPGSIDIQQTVAQWRNDTAPDQTAIKEDVAGGSFYATTFRNEAADLQASECARLRLLEGSPAQSS
jgi:hypothetical protein